MEQEKGGNVHGNTILRFLQISLLLSLGWVNGSHAAEQPDKIVYSASIRPAAGTSLPTGDANEALGKSNSGSMVNEFTGQAAFNVNLGGITAQNGLAYSLNMSYYGGGQEVFTKTNPQFAPGSWVGAGFTLKPPSISVSGENILLENQKYSLSLDGVSQQEMVQIGSTDEFVLKNNPYIRIHRTQDVRSTILKDRCPNQLNTLTTYNTPYIAYWMVTLTDGTNYLFGSGTGNCDDSEYELCQPIVGNYYKYKPFYTLEQNAKSTVVFFLSRIMDRQGKTAIWFKYDKVTEDAVGSCNAINTTPTYTTSLDRAVYLQEIYSTNGPNSGNFKTSQILLNSVTKTEEPVYPPLLQNPMAFYENRKLQSIQFLENGSLINTLAFNYSTSANRMVLDSVSAQAPQLSATRKFLDLTYLAGTTRLTSMEDASGKILEYGYGTLETAPVTGTSSWFQTLGLPDPYPDDGIAFPYPNTRVVMARQIGNKFYLQLENWSLGCSNANTGDTWRERLYEFENNGTYWSWKRVFTAPDNTCPTAVDFFIAPDGNYFIWSSYTTGVNSKVRVYDLTTDEENPEPVDSFDYIFTAGTPAHTEIITYPNWFAIYNTSHNKNVSFHYKTSAGNWTGDCPASIAPSTYAATNANPRTANYSGEDEGVSACLTFSTDLAFYPGSNFLVVSHDAPDVLHVFAYDGNGIQDYVKGLESTTPPLPNFTVAEVGDGSLRALPRPWFRTTTGGVRYDNNWAGKNVNRIAVSDNLIAVKSEANDDWKYLYVLGWDGKQLRYLYDEGLHAYQDGDGGADQLDLVAGPDYFVLKNHFTGADPVTRRGFFYYKVDLKAWTVSKSRLPVDVVPNVSAEDWVMKAYPDYLFLEKMAEGKGPMAFNTALTTDGETYTGEFYPTLHESRVFGFDNTRTAIDVSDEFSRNPNISLVNTGNLSSQGDRILGVDTYWLISPPPPRTLGYQTWRRNTNVGAGARFTRVPLKVSLPGAGQYYSARLVSGGTMVTTYHKTSTEESFTGIRFYPDAFDLVPSSANPANLVQGSTVVTSLKIKTDGAASTGNQIQQINFTYPGVSPEGATADIYKNFQSGVPNFKYVKKEFAEGASVTGFARDEINAPLPLKGRSLIGTRTKSWLLPDKASFKKPGGSVDSTLMQAVSLPNLSTESFTVQSIRDSSRAYFHSAHRGSAVYSTDYDLKNGKSKITVSKVKVSATVEEYAVKLDVYHQDLVPTHIGPSFDMLRQSATFQFPDDPCERDPSKTDPCANLNLAWFTNARMPYILSSTIMTYDAAARINAVYQWKPDFLGAGNYPPLDGNPANPVPPASGWIWKKVSSISQRQDEVAVARCKSDLPTETEQMGIFTTSFYGGADCNQLGSVTNSAQFSTALLNGEENIKSENCPGGFPCLGGFGRWVATGSVLQNQVVHSGENAIQVTSLYGPSINLKIREKAGFMDRKKGFVISGWMLAKPNSDPAFRVEFRHNVSPPVPRIGDPVVYYLDLVQEYIAAKGAFPVNKWVKLERLIPYEELSTQGIFGAPPSHDYLRIWPGKGAATTAEAVYVDDVRLYPADAQVMTRNFDGTGQLSSELNAENEPTFLEYDIWRNPVGARKKDGLVHSSTAVKLIHE